MRQAMESSWDEIGPDEATGAGSDHDEREVSDSQDDEPGYCTLNLSIPKNHTRTRKAEGIDLTEGLGTNNDDQVSVSDECADDSDPEEQDETGFDPLQSKDIDPSTQPGTQIVADSDEDNDAEEDAIAVASDRGGLEAMRSMYRALYEEEGLVAMAMKAMNRYSEDSNTLTDTAELARTTAWHVMMTTHPDVLQSLLKGTLLADAKDDEDLRRILDTMSIRACDVRFPQPAIYQNIFANELLQCADAMEEYCDQDGDHTRARQVDSFRKPLPKLASGPYRKRKYLTPQTSKSISDARKSHVTTFLAGLRKRIEEVDINERDLPLKCPLVEIGYTQDTEARLKAHLNHTNSNYIMNLMDAVANMLWPDRFKIHQFVIFLCTHTEQAVIAEILFTRLTHGYITNGGGFTYYAAGRSNDSARNPSSVEGAKWEANARRKKEQANKAAQAIGAKIKSIREKVAYLGLLEGALKAFTETIQSVAGGDES
ncbi:unnamed protein product [Zymoseptoria tritici ST99CH_1A5]|uniref:Uncharacterized protein n=1 Tax=Zymoseptoria tritici ST99CH_1A5 TaxID=1276529 RepID=A0A1Y6LXA1_ZYMTR|nr:unnamed protein product [Zymoseptoria tritici ST99CH_1A5]